MENKRVIVISNGKHNVHVGTKGLVIAKMEQFKTMNVYLVRYGCWLFGYQYQYLKEEEIKEINK